MQEVMKKINKIEEIKIEEIKIEYLFQEILFNIIRKSNSIIIKQRLYMLLKEKEKEKKIASIKYYLTML